MKAVVIRRYGGPEVLEVRDIPIPSVERNEVQIKIHASVVNSTDPVFRKGQPFVSRFFSGLLKPKNPIPGDVLAGEITEIGSAVTRFKIGDRVYGYTIETSGAHAEYKCLPEDSALVSIPEGISFKEAAGIVDGGHTALVFLRDRAAVRKGQKVLVYGASGSVGTAAVQLAVFYGAQVTAVCSKGNVEMVKSLEAERVIDYTSEDFSQGDETYDIIFDTVAKSSFAQCRNVLTDNGVYLSTFPSPSLMLKALFQSKTKGKRALFAAAGLTPADRKIENLQFLSELLLRKKLKAVIDREYPLDDIAAAHSYVEAGHKRGNVILCL